MNKTFTIAALGAIASAIKINKAFHFDENTLVDAT
jgi:hypothetical protein